MRPRNFRWVGYVLMGIFFVAAVVFLTMTLWNWLIPDLFHGPVITYWQAFGLLLLGKLLFGWHNHHKGGGGPFRRGREWKEKLKARMEQMTEEEREAFRAKMRRCGDNMDRGRWGRHSRWRCDPPPFTDRPEKDQP